MPSALSSAIRRLSRNGRQWEAFTADGHVVVLAPPGSGKTAVLTTRVAHDLAVAIKEPCGAACVTLTNAAAGEMRRRIERLGVSTRRLNFFMGTLHSFALQAIVRPYGAAAGLDTSRRIGSAAELAELFAVAVQEIYGYNENPRSLRTTFDATRRGALSEADRADDGSRMMRLVQSFEAKLQDAGLIDFDELIRLAVALVDENQWIRDVLRARFPRLYVDEYQDLAPGLDRIVSRLSFGEGERVLLFAVGDPDQSIFGFAGASPELLRALAARPAVRVVSLRLNYRCSREIVAASLAVLQEPRDVRGRFAGGTIEVHYCPQGFAEQCAVAADTAITLERAGVPLEEVALLAPTHAQLRGAAAVLRARGVAVYHRAPEEYPLIDATEAVELSADWATSPLGQTSARLATILRSVRRAVGRSDSGLEALIVEQLVRLRDADAPTVENLVRGLDDAGLSHALNGQLDRSEQFQALDLLRQRYGPGSPNGHITLLDYAALMRGAGQVRLSTLHAGKGLEFEAVLILALDEGVLPRTYRATPASLAEDRRKFYVALTRARRRLHLFYSGSHVIPDGRVLNEGPSRFLADIGL